MKRFFLASLLVLSTAIHAQADEKTARPKLHNGSVLLGFGDGGTAFGFAYEYMPDQSEGLGGHLRIFPKDDSAPGTNTGFTIMGGSLAYHFYKRAWDLSFSPSVNIINIDALSGNDETTMGPGLSISLMTHLTDMISIGFDNSRYWVWFNDKYRGAALDDFAVRLRAGF